MIPHKQANIITVNVSGRLGNQLLQYTAALALYSKYAHSAEEPEVWVDTSFFLHSRNTRSFRLHRMFPDIRVHQDISDNQPDDRIVYQEQDIGFSEDFFTPPPSCILRGYFQDFRYFEAAKPYFRPRLFPMPALYQRLKDESYQLVALHVRRGDFLDLEDYHAIVPVAYYHCALEQIREQISNPYVLVFSDDIPWAQNNIEFFGLPHQFVQHEGEDADIQDFSIMAGCQHFILSNSSYSGMAAQLGGYQHNSLVFMPTVLGKAKNVLTRQRYSPEWRSVPYMFYQDSPPEDPAVSIIIPVYNTKEYLDRCLESVCNQTEKNIEIIIVDDASPDDSWSLIQEYAKRDSRIVTIRHEYNKHSGGARNSGIETARGKYLMFLDSDDYIRKDTVEIFLQKAKQYPELELIMCCIYQLIKGELRVFGNENLHEEQVIKDVLQQYMDGAFFHCAWAKLWKRDLWMRTNIRFPEHIAMQDLSTIPRLLIYLNRALIIPQRLFFYQYRTTSITGCYSENVIKDYGKALALMKNWTTEELSSPERELFLARMCGEVASNIHGICPNLDREIKNHYQKPLSELFAELAKNSVYAERLQFFCENTLPFQGIFLLYSIAVQKQLQQNACVNWWYQFGQSSRRRKVWIIAKMIVKKTMGRRLFNVIKKLFLWVFRRRMKN